MSTIWAAGRYESVAEHIAGIAETVVGAVDRRSSITDSAVVDLACGTGSAALAAARRGARVTALDFTSELVGIGESKARAAGLTIDWHTGDAADTGLPTAAFDAAVSNMGIIFVEPTGQVTELARLVKSGGVLGFSSWVRDSVNPLFDPIVSVLGTPPARAFTPDQWGDRAVTEQRLGAEFDAIEFTADALTWRFDSPASALAFVTQESPMHVDILSRIDTDQRAALTAAFDAALTALADDEGVCFDASYVVVTALRR